MAWYLDNSGKTTAVATKNPNSWGYYDMHGNVWEWCLDPHESDRAESYRAYRGGCWDIADVGCRYDNRYVNVESYRDGILGFRPAAVPSEDAGSGAASAGNGTTSVPATPQPDRTAKNATAGNSPAATSPLAQVPVARATVPIKLVPAKRGEIVGAPGVSLGMSFAAFQKIYPKAEPGEWIIGTEGEYAGLPCDVIAGFSGVALTSIVFSPRGLVDKDDLSTIAKAIEKYPGMTIAPDDLDIVFVELWWKCSINDRNLRIDAKNRRWTGLRNSEMEAVIVYAKDFPSPVSIGFRERTK